MSTLNQIEGVIKGSYLVAEGIIPKREVRIPLSECECFGDVYGAYFNCGRQSYLVSTCLESEYPYKLNLNIRQIIRI